MKDLTKRNQERNNAQKLKFPINDFFSKYDQIRRKLQIWSYLLKKSLMRNFIFRAVKSYCYLGIVLGKLEYLF